MPVHQSFQIRGRGPTGAVMVNMDDLGIRDGSNYFYNVGHHITVPLLAAGVDSFIWVCMEGIWVVAGVAEAHTVVGGSGATVTVVVCPQAVAVASGTAQLSAALDLTVTAPAKSFGTLIATPTPMTRGDALATDLAGTLTGLVGVLTVLLKRVG